MTEELDDIRKMMLERFDAWLERVLGEEEIPSGIPAEIWAELCNEDSNAESSQQKGDLYSVYAAMTALVQEVRLQGRAFKQLSDNLEPVRTIGEALDESIVTHAEALAEARRIADEALAQKNGRERALAADAEVKANRAFLVLLIELYERLKRSLEPAAQLADVLSNLARPSWRSKLAGLAPEIRVACDKARTAGKGIELTFERLGEILRDFDLHEMECVGLPFDPLRMCADDIEETTDTPDGVVLQVYRPGYEVRGEVFQTARVKVARNRIRTQPSPIGGLEE